jgi:LysR family transcriptional regulator, glycine cleavage system transcriptional activator
MSGEMTQRIGRALPPMTALPVFEAVGRHLSVARAADELHLTSGAVSRQVHNLEDFLGLALFERAHRRIVFTAAGEVYWAKVHAALSALREVTSDVSASADRRPLVIAAPRMFLQKCVMPALGSLYAAHPEMVVNFVTGRQDLEGVDGEIAVSPSPRQGFIIEALAAADLLPVCSPAYLAAAPPLETPDDLDRHTLLRSAEYTRNWERWLGHRTQRVFNHARFIDFESSGLELTGAAEGLGVAIVRLRLVQDEIAAGRLIPLFPEHVVHEHYSFTFSESKLRSSRFKRFRVWLRDAVAA